jgi:glutathione S-transferase
MASNNVITFYDIASDEPLRTFAPNTFKSRYALNYKRVPYKTEWVDTPDIHALRERLGVPANRTLPDGSPYHTLPVIHDASTGNIVGDSFEIALYLDNQYPEKRSLFRPMTTGLTAAFNAQVDNIFTKYVPLATEMPFPPRCAEAVGAMFAKRFGVKDLSEMALSDEAREELLVEFEIALGELAKAYRHTGGTTDRYFRSEGTAKPQGQRPPPGRESASVFLDGDQPAYADFIVGAWLKMMEASMPKWDWERLCSWQDGLWAKIADALGPWAEIK